MIRIHGRGKLLSFIFSRCRSWKRIRLGVRGIAWQRYTNLSSLVVPRPGFSCTWNISAAVKDDQRLLQTDIWSSWSSTKAKRLPCEKKFQDLLREKVAQHYRSFGHPRFRPYRIAWGFCWWLGDSWIHANLEVSVLRSAIVPQCRFFSASCFTTSQLLPFLFLRSIVCTLMATFFSDSSSLFFNARQTQCFVSPPPLPHTNFSHLSLRALCLVLRSRSALSLLVWFDPGKIQLRFHLFPIFVMLPLSFIIDFSVRHGIPEPKAQCLRQPGHSCSYHPVAKGR